MRNPARLLGLSLALCLLGSAAEAKKCPNVVFVADRSGSMSSDPNGGNQHPNKWELLRMAIIATVNKYGDRLAFGLEMFTSSAFSDQACYNDTKIDVQPAHGTAAQITQILNGNNPSGGTNTGEAIKRAYTDVAAFKDKTRGEYIVLITDGDPNCNSGDLNGGATYTIAEIGNAAKQVPAVHTFVVGFDGAGGVNPATLNQMAVKGLEPIPGCGGGVPCYYSASNTMKFLAAIDKIIGAIAGGTVVGGCDDSCFSSGCPGGQVCAIPRGQLAPVCVPDLCANMMCDQASFCRDGMCIPTCPPCAAGERCVDGQCGNDPCANVNCPAMKVCNRKTGQCVPDLCMGGIGQCPLPTYCDAVTGNCVDDPCRLINCPANSTCYDGNCGQDSPPEVHDMSVMATDDYFWEPGADLAGTGNNNGNNGGNNYVPNARQAGGCSVGGRGGVAGAGALRMLLVAAGMIVVRRRR